MTKVYSIKRYRPHCAPRFLSFFFPFFLTVSNPLPYPCPLPCRSLIFFSLLASVSSYREDPKRMENTCRCPDVRSPPRWILSFVERKQVPLFGSLSVRSPACFTSFPPCRTIPSTIGSRPFPIPGTYHLRVRHPQNRSVSRNNTRCHGHPSTIVHTNVDSRSFASIRNHWPPRCFDNAVAFQISDRKIVQEKKDKMVKGLPLSNEHKSAWFRLWRG